MIYIFSNVYRHNSKEESLECLRKYNFNEPVFCFLNKATMFYNNISFFKDKNNMLFSRKNFGFDQKIENHYYKTFNKGIFQINDDCNIFKMNVLDDNKVEFNNNKAFAYEQFQIKKFLKDIYCPVSQSNFEKDKNFNIWKSYEFKIMTTGFIIWLLFSKFLKKDVCLVNFYGSKDQSTVHWSGHNWDFEEKYLEDNSAQKIFL